MLDTVKAISRDYIPYTEGKTVASNDKFYKIFSKELPTAFQNALQGSEELLIKGCIAQPNHRYPKIPLVTFMDARVTNSAKSGYYVALLFSEDMKRILLSLNQGFERPIGKKLNRTEKFRTLKDRACSVREELQHLINDFSTYEVSADLGASLERGKGYEAGHIIGKSFEVNTLFSWSQIDKYLVSLLSIYRVLVEYYGSTLLTTIGIETEDSFQKNIQKAHQCYLPDGPLPKPSPNQFSNTGSRRRNVAVSSISLRNSGYLCQLEPAHKTFKSKSSGENFVEAHHLVPLSYQDDFTFNIDVPENIVALCPTCHRLLHHGGGKELIEAIEALFVIRKTGLEHRGLHISREQLISLYI
ncbi:MrcB family domain-containing protein [Idiomarina sp.]|uniref:MrcB family domain-containing protein n=1 Tax=Idiomarina sp. TaxID=1874361 RepID=UPI003A8F8D04